MEFIPSCISFTGQGVKSALGDAKVYRTLCAAVAGGKRAADCRQPNGPATDTDDDVTFLLHSASTFQLKTSPELNSMTGLINSHSSLSGFSRSGRNQCDCESGTGPAMIESLRAAATRYLFTRLSAHFSSPRRD